MIQGALSSIVNIYQVCDCGCVDSLVSYESPSDSFDCKQNTSKVPFPYQNKICRNFAIFKDFPVLEILEIEIKKQ